MVDFPSFGSSPSLNHHPGLKSFVNGVLASTDWNYWEALQLDNKDVREATYDMIMDNSEDVMYGVNKVEVVFNQVWFGLFNNLVVKHTESGNLTLHFYATVRSAAAVLALFDELMGLLGQGSHADPKYTFHNKYLVQDFAVKDDNDADQVIGHIWLFGNYSFNIGCADPLHQLVFTAAKTSRNAIDYSPRGKGTLISILRYSIDDILILQELSAIPFHENGKVKYVDYTFALDPLELSLFDRVTVRIFDTEKRSDKGQFHLTYFNRFELRTTEIILFADQLFKIYGSDSIGENELAPYEIDMIDGYKHWQGRSWWMNLHHTINKDKNDQDKVLYWIYYLLDPEEHGFALHVVGFNDMLDYHQKYFANPK